MLIMLLVKSASRPDLCKVSMVQTGRWRSRRGAHRPAAAPTSGSPLSQLHSHTARLKQSDSQSPETILTSKTQQITVRMRRCPGNSWSVTRLNWHLTHSWRYCCPLMSFFYFNNHYNEWMIKQCRIQCQCILGYPNPNFFCSRESLKTPWLWRTSSLNSVRLRSLCFAVHVSVLWRGV